MKDQELFDNLEGAIQHKENIYRMLLKHEDTRMIEAYKKLGWLDTITINSPYYYKETVTVKHRTSILGINADPYRTSHTEIRFNEAKFNQDVANADQQIKHYQTLANQRINDLQNQLIGLVSQTTQDHQNIRSYVNIIDSYKVKIHNYHLSSSVLNHSLERLKADINCMNDQIKATQSKIDALPSQIATAKAELSLNKERLANEVQLTNDAEAKLAEVNDAVYQKVLALDYQERAHLLAEMFDKTQASSLVSKINSAGFDANYLAYLALEKNHIDLFNFALKRGADCSAYAIEQIGNKTILQQAIALNLEEFIVKILAKQGQDITATLMNSLKQNDTNSFEVLLKREVPESYKKVHGCTFLHHAINLGNKELVKKIIETNINMLEAQTENGDTTFKLALRSGNTEIIKLIAHHIDIEQELKAIIENNQTTLLNSALSVDILTNEIKQSLLTHAVTTYNPQASELLADHGASYLELFRTAIILNDNNLVYTLADNDPTILNHNFENETNESGNPDMPLLLANLALTFESDII